MSWADRQERTGGITVRTPTFSVEVITLPVSNVERALRFYVDQVGFTLDVDYSPNDTFRVVQLTPPGSSCSIQIGKGLTDAPVGSLRNVYLVVTNLQAARTNLLERGVNVGEIRHKTPFGAWDGGFAPGLDPARGERQLCHILRSRWQQLGVTGKGLPQCVTKWEA
jgi:catechol 2,3-dioxygenase-like lactoylglutathione lyase family enzyme